MTQDTASIFRKKEDDLIHRTTQYTNEVAVIVVFLTERVRRQIIPPQMQLFFLVLTVAGKDPAILPQCHSCLVPFTYPFWGQIRKLFLWTTSSKTRLRKLRCCWISWTSALHHTSAVALQQRNLYEKPYSWYHKVCVRAHGSNGPFKSWKTSVDRECYLGASRCCSEAFPASDLHLGPPEAPPGDPLSSQEGS